MRRVHISRLSTGDQRLSAEESHHLRDVLRVDVGDTVELFDARGRVARGTIAVLAPTVIVTVEAIAERAGGRRITVASAVPKGDRADWMIEKLSEIGVSEFVPLRSARSVVHPEGAGKLDRWRRIAVEAAKQSHRAGVLSIQPLATLDGLLKTTDPTTAIYFSTTATTPLRSTLDTRHSTLLVGPEGGWTDDEEAVMRAAGLTSASLGPTILRIETAAVLSAGLLMLLSPEIDHP